MASRVDLRKPAQGLRKPVRSSLGWALTVALALVTTPAAAYDPGKIPPGTVLGNSRGATAVPFPIPGGAGGKMVGYPSPTWSTNAASTTAFIYTVPAGWPAFTCTTTTTQCFDEALAYRATATNGVAIGLTLELSCPSGNGAYIQAASAVDTRVMRQNGIINHGCLINFAGTITGDTFKINTMLDGARFQWDAQIVCHNNTPTDGTSCVAIHPTITPPFEGANGLGVFNSPIHIGAIATGTTGAATPAGAVLSINSDTGSSVGTTVTVGEINCNGPASGSVSQDGVRVEGATAITGWLNNWLVIGTLHQCRNGVVIGTSTDAGAHPENYRGNTVSVQRTALNNPDNTTGIAVHDYGNNNHIFLPDVNTNEGDYNLAVKLESTVTADVVDTFASGFGAAKAYLDQGGSNTIRATGTMIWGAGSFFDYPPVISGAIGAIVAGLPPSPTKGMIAYVEDGDSSSVGVTVGPGGGSNSDHVFLWYDGTNWRVFGVQRQQKTTDLGDTVGGSCGAGDPVWTPALKLGGASTGMTYGTQVGCYNAMSEIHVGQFNLILTAKGSSTGAATITGLPIAQAATGAGSCVISEYLNMSGLTTQPFGAVAASGTTITLAQAGATGHSALDDTFFTNTTQIRGTCTWLGP